LYVWHWYSLHRPCLATCLPLGCMLIAAPHTRVTPHTSPHCTYRCVTLLTNSPSAKPAVVQSLRDTHHTACNAAVPSCLLIVVYTRQSRQTNPTSTLAESGFSGYSLHPDPNHTNHMGPTAEPKCYCPSQKQAAVSVMPDRRKREKVQRVCSKKHTRTKQSPSCGTTCTIRLEQHIQLQLLTCQS
jgi:hypothetical protein